MKKFNSKEFWSAVIFLGFFVLLLAFVVYGLLEYKGTIKSLLHI